MDIYTGWIADVVAGRLFAGRFGVDKGKIAFVEESTEALPKDAPCYAPGFVDAHVHVESSLLPPCEFARAAVVHGTLAAVSDPHEIANVLGVAGVQWMLDEADHTPFYFNFGAPSCVPATPFETAGGVFDAATIGKLLDDPRVRYLSEVMNFPAVIGGDGRMAAILDEAKRRKKPIDGHSPGVSGEALRRYANAGITTDHECSTLQEGRDRVREGIKVLIREGSAARNFEVLWPLLNEAPESVMLCHDDLHPDELHDRMIETLMARALDKGVPLMNVLRAATLNPVRHYGLPMGLLLPGDSADFVELKDFSSLRVLRSFIAGKCAAENGACKWPRRQVRPVNRFEALPRTADDFKITASGTRVRVIGAIDGELFTQSAWETPLVQDGLALSDPARDLLKIAVVNRYAPRAPVALGFVRGFGLKTGALASSVAHDSHNIVAVGVSDADICRAVNAVITHKGGLVSVGPAGETVLPLPIAGLMSDLPFEKVSQAYLALNQAAVKLGSPMRSPFMTLAFMALPVIPELKLTDKGLFDVSTFAPTALWS